MRRGDAAQVSMSARDNRRLGRERLRDYLGAAEEAVEAYIYGEADNIDPATIQKLASVIAGHCMAAEKIGFHAGALAEIRRTLRRREITDEARLNAQKERHRRAVDCARRIAEAAGLRWVGDIDGDGIDDEAALERAIADLGDPPRRRP
jgi:hypothetical protein